MAMIYLAFLIGFILSLSVFALLADRKEMTSEDQTDRWLFR